MPRDLRQLLHQTAAGPSGEPDVHRLVHRGRRRRRTRHATAAVAAATVVLTGAVVTVNTLGEPSTPQIADQPPPTPSATPGASATPTPSATASIPDADAGGPVDLEPVLCAANEICPMMFELDGITYEVLDLCDPVAPDAVGDAVRIPGRGSPRLPTAVHELKEFPISAGVAVDFDHCDDRTLALPGRAEDREEALVRARLHCDVLRDPAPEDRCDRGGDAEWRVGNAHVDDAFAPFPEFVADTDAAIDAGAPEWEWRTDPLEVATRRYEDEKVCHDAGTPCPWDVTPTEESDERVVVEGIVKPAPDVTWDIRIEVERLGEHSWWTTRMTVAPRPAD